MNAHKLYSGRKVALLAAAVGFSSLQLSVCNGQTTAPTVLDKIGYTDLQQSIGPSLADGTGVKVAIVEAAIRLINNPDPTPDVFGFTPDSSNASLAGRAIVPIPTSDPTITTMTTGHATGSASRFIGSGSSSPGVAAIGDGTSPVVVADAIYAGSYLGFLGSGTGVPGTNRWDVSNHSYILISTAANPLSAAEATDLSLRLDYSIQQGGGTAVVGSSNGLSTNVPLGLAPAYNVISVGRSDGNHGSGLTSFYGPSGEVTLPAGVSGRVKVDIVAPEGTTSAATPRVASAAALLHDSGVALDVDSVETETMKAILLAGATKDEFPSWDKTSVRPLDDRYGAGELNIFNSYMIQAGGQQEGSSSVAGAPVTSLGWDYQSSFDPLLDRSYQLTVAPGAEDNELSVILNWNVQVDDLPGTGFDPSVSLADFNLQLTEDATGNVIDISQSEVDNVEHIFAEDLSAGTYTLAVSGDTDQAYGLAWRLTSVPEPGSASLLTLLLSAGFMKRRRI